jgi:putative transposase
MTEYRRFYIPESTWFFTVNLAERKNNNLLIDNIDLLRDAFKYVKQQKPFHMNAVVIMSDHLHCIWSLPLNDADFSIRWNLLKGRFSRGIPPNERISTSRETRRERGIWQRRFWAHLIENQDDFNRHVDYIHWNPVKHGKVNKVVDWPYSSFHRYVKQSVYSNEWAGGINIDINGGE